MRERVRARGSRGRSFVRCCRRRRSYEPGPELAPVGVGSGQREGERARGRGVGGGPIEVVIDFFLVFVFVFVFVVLVVIFAAAVATAAGRRGGEGVAEAVVVLIGDGDFFVVSAFFGKGTGWSNVEVGKNVPDVNASRSLHAFFSRVSLSRARTKQDARFDTREQAHLYGLDSGGIGGLLAALAAARHRRGAGISERQRVVVVVVVTTNLVDIVRAIFSLSLP